MKYLSLTVYKDSAGVYPSGKSMPVPSDATVRGVDVIPMQDDNIQYCPPDYAPTMSLLQLFSNTMGTIWVNETIASYESKRSGIDCCGPGMLSTTVEFSGAGPINTTTVPSLIGRNIDFIIYNQSTGSSLLPPIPFNSATGVFTFTGMGGLDTNTSITIIYH